MSPTRLPGFQSDVTLNPTLTAGTNPTRKPIIIGVGDVKILIENEKVVRGAVADTADALASTIFGASDTTRLAGILRIGDSPDSADYVKTTDYIATNSTVDWSPAADQPAVGAEYYITYYKALSNFSVTEYNILTDILTAHGSKELSLTRQFGNVSVGTSATIFEWLNETTDAPTGTITDWEITFTTGANTGYTRTVSAYTLGEFTVSTAFPNTPAVGDIFLLTRADNPLVNTVVAGADLALKNGASSVIVGQLDNTSGTPWVNKLQPTGAEYGISLAVHLTTLRGYTEVPYHMVGMVPDDTAMTNADLNTNIHNTILSHVKLMTSPENQGERYCHAGYLKSSGTKATDITNFKSYAQTFSYQRITVIAPGDFEYTDLAGKTVNGSLCAAAIAGKICSYQRVSQSMLKESLTGILLVDNYFNRIEQRDLFLASLTIAIDDNGVTKIIAGVTTDGSTADTQDLAIQAIADNLRKSGREEMEATFQGLPISSNTLADMVGKQTSIFEKKISEGIIVAYDPQSIQVRQNSAEPRQIDITASVSPLYNIWWGDISYSFYV